MKRLILIFFCFFCVNNTFADKNKNINSFKEIINNLKTLSGNFKQYNVTNNKQNFESSGKVFISKPNKFRWDITNPNNQILASDGKKIINYDIDLEQVSIKSIKNTDKNIPIFILSGDFSDIEKNYKVSLVNDNFNSSSNNSEVSKKLKNKIETYELVPLESSNKKEPKNNSNDQNISAVKMSFSGKILNAISIYSNKKLITLIKFSKVSLNKKIDEKKFKIFIPKNVEILK